MEAPQGVLNDKTVTFVQVLTVSDMAEAAALVASEMNQNTPMANPIMQIVVQTPDSAAALAGASEETVVISSHDPSVTPNIETITMATSESHADQKANVIPSNNKTATNVSSGEERLCLICGDKANGVHYNVLSCEGCKSFFLRSNRSGATFTCASGGNCNMDLYTRRHCPACRMKRCLECGMKVERVWDKGRLKTRKPLIRVKRKKKVPGIHADSATSPTVAPPTPGAPPTPAPAAAPPNPASSSILPQQLPIETSLSSTPSSSRSSSPSANRSSLTVTPNMSTNPIPSAVQMDKDMLSFSDPSQQMTGDSGMLTIDLDTPGTSTQTLLTFGSTYPQLTLAQEQLMITLEKGYNASTEVLKHLSKDVPLFRMTHWSKFKGGDSESPIISQGEEEEDMDQPKPKKARLDAQESNTNTNSAQQQTAAQANGRKGVATPLNNDPLAVLSSATGQNIEVIYNLTSLATGGQIKDPASALSVLASSEQGLRVIESIGSLVQGQDLNTLISLAKLVGQIIGMGGGSLNDNLADTILGSITGSILNSSNGNTASSLSAELALNMPSASALIPSGPSQDQNGNNGGQGVTQDETMNSAAVAKLASSGLAEALAMLAAMASSSQNKETIVEMVKRAAVSLLRGEDEPQMMSFSSPPTSSPASNNFYMPTDVGEDEVKTSPFLQSLQRVTSFLTSGKMSAGKKSSTKAKRTVNKEMLHIAMDMFAVLVKQTIHFAKSIPGFTNLSCDDQAVLIKSSIVDALLLRCADSYALDKDCLVNVTNGDKFDVHMMYQLGFSTLPEVVFEFMRDTKACGLTTAEYALFTAAALLSPDRSDLKDRKTVEEMQLEMILALQAATKVFHADKPFLFTKLITKLTTLRDMSILHLSEIMAVKVQEQDLSPLIVELFGLDS
ncbi:uncharacterized protein LOC121418600 [Lytechinus variegatus]|uniref:uncharacterized protein LOC121418600 n=1 Tax=Lytechinus variegatus TaxID=7654 RepID=UPI001BB17A35|nr:uncharacterized protein LOC121418600 [Lytechinus variegatus]XP_041468495.1 uncharacterized protein LOC121418600 [Lytechinus variegatus]XP_041468496.1 uncharacterized protein LOC121418600 [Lytechinus variegatus]